MPSGREIEAFFRTVQLLFVVHLWFPHDNKLLMNFSFENEQTYTKLLLRLMLANHTTAGCFKPSWPVLISTVISTQQRLDSRHYRTRLVVLKKKDQLFFEKIRPEFEIGIF